MSAPRSSPPLRVVVGGGIGSGKTAVARIMERLGATVIVADELGHRVLDRGGEAHAAVAETWPEVVVDGEIDRGALAAIVFADAAELARLEALTHPAITSRLEEAVAAAEGDVVVETPLPGIPSGGDWIRILVDAPPAVRLERAVARGGSREDVRRRMSSQPDRESWLLWADHVIVNDATFEDLSVAVGALWRRLKGVTGPGATSPAR